MEKRFNLKKLAAVATVSMALIGCSAPLVNQAINPTFANAAVNNRNAKQNKQNPNKHYDIKKPRHGAPAVPKGTGYNVIPVKQKTGTLRLPKPIDAEDIMSFNGNLIKLPKGTLVHYHADGFGDMEISTDKLHNNSQHQYITSGIFLNSLSNTKNKDGGQNMKWKSPKGYDGQKPIHPMTEQQKNKKMMKGVGKTYGHSSLPRTADSHMNLYVGGGIIVAALAGIFALLYFGRVPDTKGKARK